VITGHYGRSAMKWLRRAQEAAKQAKRARRGTERRALLTAASQMYVDLYYRAIEKEREFQEARQQELTDAGEPDGPFAVLWRRYAR